ncbi:MAG: glycosyltransferase [Gammaproteobacteria bacterium]|nr:glycosyltransferase [Gammaproteobacteria bacterium]
MLAPKSIVVSCDNFWIGGRETFIESNVGLLRAHGVEHVSLMATSIDNPRAAEVFDECVEIPPQIIGSQAALALMDQLVDRFKPDFVWAHHYGLPLSMLLASRHGLKVHVTMHGPPLSMGRYQGAEAIAFVKLLCRGGSFSCVSEEIAQQVSSLPGQHQPLAVIPNRVPIPVKTELSKISKGPIRFLMMARQSKLDHLRQSLLCVAAFARAGCKVEMEIVTGVNLVTADASRSASGWRHCLRLFGRKWLGFHPSVWRVLSRVRIRPMSPSVAKALKGCDVVLGMGRVVLEGLAHSKPAILVGYDAIIDRVTPENFAALQQTNFSGRGQRPNAIKDIISSTLAELRNGEEQQKLQGMVALNASWPTLQGLIAEIMNAEPPKRLSDEEQKSLVAALSETADEAVMNVLSKAESELYMALTR